MVKFLHRLSRSIFASWQEDVLELLQDVSCIGGTAENKNQRRIHQISTDDEPMTLHMPLSPHLCNLEGSLCPPPTLLVAFQRLADLKQVQLELGLAQNALSG